MPWPLRIWPLAVMAVAATTALVLLVVLIDSDVSRVALPVTAGAIGTIALAAVTVRPSIGNSNTRIGCASLIALAGFHKALCRRGVRLPAPGSAGERARRLR
jgi:hypothetical protein